MPVVDEAQRRYFERTEHQYPRGRVLLPPLHSAQELAGVLAALAGVPRDRPVIDFGAGTGRLTIALARAGYRVLAVDTNERSLAVLADIASALGLNGVQVATELPTGRAYCAVVGADVLHHVDLDEVLPRFHALLEDGGRIVFTEPGGLNPAWYAWFALLRDLGPERGISCCNIRTLSRTLRRHGFRNTRISGVGLLPRPLFGWSVTACRVHDRCGSLPVLRWVAYRYRIEATKGLLPNGAHDALCEDAVP